MPAPVPYANLSNPQTLNLYAMVSDNPETFADLDGHDQNPNPFCGGVTCYDENGKMEGSELGFMESEDVNPDEFSQSDEEQEADEKPTQNPAQQAQLVIQPTVVPGSQLNFPSSGREEKVDYNVVSLDSKGQTSSPDAYHTVTLTEKLIVPDKNKKANPEICSAGCTSSTPNLLRDTDSISSSAKGHTVEKRFTVARKPARIYDPTTKKTYDYLRVAASMKKGFVFSYGNDPQ